MRRRDFFQLVSVTAGGMALASCDDGNGPTDPTRPVIPNGMTFFPVKNSGTPLPGGGTLRTMRLDATLDGVGEVFYGANSDGGVPGLYAMQLTFTDDSVTAGAERVVARVGDAIGDGRTITGLFQYDVNATGGLAMALADAPANDLAHPETAIWLDRTKTGLTRVLYDGLDLPGGWRVQGRFADVDIHSNDDLLVVGHVRVPFMRNGQPAHHELREAIIFVPGADPSAAHVVATTRQIPGQEDGTSGRFGLVDLHDNGAYVVQGTMGTSGNAKEPAFTRAMMLQGNVSPAARSGGPVLSVVGAAAVPAGTAFYGPRMGPDGHAAFVAHLTETTTALFYRGERELETGDLTPRGNTVRGIYPPVIGPGNEAYVVVNTDGGDELLVINGQERRALLGHGDRLSGDERVVVGLMIGSSTTAVDQEGRLALIACFEDHSAAVTIGIPR